jgi:hypothetical protein
MFNYLTGPIDWNSEGIPNYINESIVDPDPYIIFSLNKTFVSGIDLSAEMLSQPAYRNLLIQSDDSIFNGAKVSVTFLNVITPKLNAIGYCMFLLDDNFIDMPTIIDPITNTNRPITRQDIINDDNLGTESKNITNRTILFPTCNRTNKNAYLPRGATVELSPIHPKFAYQGNVSSGFFANNVGIGFFLMPDGWNDITKKIGSTPEDLKNILYSNDNLNLISQLDSTLGHMRQNIMMYDDIRSYSTYTSMTVNFNDDDIQYGDRDFSDLSLQVKISPPICIDHTKYAKFEQITKTSYTEYIFDNYGFYIVLNAIDYLALIQYKKVIFEHHISSTSEELNNDLFNIFNAMYFNNSTSSVDLVDMTSFKITTHINPTKIPFESRTYHVFRMDENTTQPYHADDTLDNDEQLFDKYANTTNVITEYINIMINGNLYKQITNNGTNRVNLSYY